jgi:hypothetical protein
MRRIALTVLLFATLAAPAQAAPPAKVTLTECSVSGHAAEFEARMGKVEGATRLKMRYALQVRRPGQKTFHGVSAPGFRSWTTAAPGKTSWIFTRRVEALIGPARYRAQVRFLWLDRHGKAIAQAKKVSRACKQPDPRPNLTVKALSHEGKHRYVALVANNGRSTSGPFDLQLMVGDTLLSPVSVAGLAPQGQRLVTLHGPACKPGKTVTATVDPLDVIDERNEADNAFTMTCA